MWRFFKNATQKVKIIGGVQQTYYNETCITVEVIECNNNDRYPVGTRFVRRFNVYVEVYKEEVFLTNLRKWKRI